MKTFRFSPKYFILASIFFILEVIIAIYVHDDFIRPYVGDVIVMFLMYSFIKAFIGKPTKRLPYYLFGFAVTIEFLQLVNFTQLLGLDQYPIATIVLGSVFDVRDVISYFVGMLLLLGYEQALRKDISYL